MDIKIRKANRKDFDKLLELNQKLFNYEKKFGNTYDENWPFSERGRTYFASRIENGIIFVAESDNVVIGYICTYIDNYSFRLLNPIAEIENMFVEEDFRSYGVGTSLIKSVMAVLKDKKVALVKVGAIDSNTKTVDFYIKNGFKRHEIFLEMKVLD